MVEDDPDAPGTAFQREKARIVKSTRFRRKCFWPRGKGCFCDRTVCNDPYEKSARIKMPTPIKRPTSENYWLRKKVPEPLRAVVGKTEVWAPLGTKDPRQASIKIGVLNAALEAEWGPPAGRTSPESDPGEAGGAEAPRALAPGPARVARRGARQDPRALERQSSDRLRQGASYQPGRRKPRVRRPRYPGEWGLRRLARERRTPGPAPTPGQAGSRAGRRTRPRGEYEKVAARKPAAGRRSKSA